MEQNLKISLLTICKLLDKFKVKYMLVGGTAVALHGYYRHSTNSDGDLIEKPDVDIWYKPTYENYFSILKVIEGLGQDITEFKNESTPNPQKSYFRLDFDNFSVDLLPEIKAAIKFQDADKRKETIVLESTQIHFMSYPDLIKDKEETGRKKDLEDIKQLKNKKSDE